MTSEKIKTILEEYYGISEPLNCWLKLPQISVIYLHCDPKIYIDETELYYFDSSKKMLYVSKSERYRNLGVNDVTEELSAYPVHTKYAMDTIAGFIQTSEVGPYGTLITKY